jgi:hypothetical protein
MRKLSRALFVLFACSRSLPSATLILKRAWIEKFKDRATIDATFTIDHAHPRPNAPKDDGDMHVAGRAPKEIGLPMVAEIMNAAAANEQTAVKLIHDNEGNGQFIAVTGAWRLWFEHPPATGKQTQFADVPKAGNTNPDHCFEIHPLTKVGGNDLKGSLRSIKGFKPKEAQAAFGAYEKLSVSLSATSTAITLNSKKSGFNYVLFTFRAVGKSKALDDGGVQVMANVVVDDGDEDEALAENVRMIFVPGSDPAKAVAGGLNNGDELTVLGIPRLNLNAISAALNAAQSGPVTRKLPYEMIIVALEGASAGSSGRPR